MHYKNPNQRIMTTENLTMIDINGVATAKKVGSSGGDDLVSESNKINQLVKINNDFYRTHMFMNKTYYFDDLSERTSIY